MIRMTMTVCRSKKEITHVTAGFTVRGILCFRLFEWILSYKPEGQLIPEQDCEVWMLEWSLPGWNPCCTSCGVRGNRCSEITSRSASGPFLLCHVSSSPSAALSDSVLLPESGKKEVLHLLHNGYIGYSVFLSLWQIQIERLCWAKWISFNLNIEMPECSPGNLLFLLVLNLF